MNYLKKILKNNKNILYFYVMAKKARRVLKRKYGVIKTLKLFLGFKKDFLAYQKNNTNKDMPIRINELYPCIFDKTEQTPLDHTYFYQDSWCAKKIFENKPKHHYDFGSKAEMIGILSQFVPTTMLDIRPIDVELEGLSFKKADILKTNIPSNSIESLSSICVLEHIGLGRYGDELDPFGTEKSAEEIKRILSEGADFYLSLPVDNENKIYFNAHRAFTRNYILKMFSPLKLIEEKYIYGRRMFNNYMPQEGFGTGLFHFKK